MGSAADFETLTGIGTLPLASNADVLIARHAIFPRCEERSRDEPFGPQRKAEWLGRRN